MPVSKQPSPNYRYQFTNTSAPKVSNLVTQLSYSKNENKMRQTFQLTQPSNRIVEENDDYSQKSQFQENKQIFRETQSTIFNIETYNYDSDLNIPSRKNLINQLNPKRNTFMTERRELFPKGMQNAYKNLKN